MKSIPSMSLKTKAMKSLGRKILCVLLSGVFFGDTIAWAEAPILPDTTAPGNRYPLVQETANGIPLVNISAPLQVVYLAMIMTASMYLLKGPF